MTAGDIADLVRYRHAETMSSSDTALLSYDAMPYGFADKRAPLVVASGEGVFELDTTGFGPMFYVNLLADHVLQLRQSDMLCSDEGVNNVLRWSEIGDDELQLLDVIGPFPVSYLYQMGIETEETVVEQVSPLLYTEWDQRISGNDIYNRYCPLKSNSSTQRAPA